MNKTFLVVGNGFLGECLIRQLQIMDFTVFFTNFEDVNQDGFYLNIEDKPSIEKLFAKINPDIVINCVANTKIDYLEQNPQIAININSIGTKNLAEVCNDANSRLIHISTDYVFDGFKGMYSETDSTNPVNEYGKSKVLSEKFVQNSLKDYVIIRTNFFGLDPKKRDLISQFLMTMKSKKSFYGFTDIFFTPLEINNLCELIIETSLTNIRGIIHLASNETISKYDLVFNVAKILSLDLSLLKKGSINNLNHMAKRPMNTSLDNSKAKKLLTTSILSLEESIKKITTQIPS